MDKNTEKSKRNFDLLFEEVMKNAEDAQESLVDEGFWRKVKHALTPRLNKKSQTEAETKDFNNEVAAAMAANDAHLQQGKRWTFEKKVVNAQGDERILEIAVTSPQKAREKNIPMKIRVKESTEDHFNKENMEEINLHMTEDEIAKIVRKKCELCLPGFKGVETAKEKDKREKQEAKAAADQQHQNEVDADDQSKD